MNIYPNDVAEFDEFLDEVYGTVTIADVEYDTSQVLRKVDPIAYDAILSDYESMQEEQEEEEQNS